MEKKGKKKEYYFYETGRSTERTLLILFTSLLFPFSVLIPISLPVFIHCFLFSKPCFKVSSTYPQNIATMPVILKGREGYPPDKCLFLKATH